MFTNQEMEKYLRTATTKARGMFRDNKRIACESANIADIVNESAAILLDRWERLGRTAADLNDSYVTDLLFDAATELKYIPVNYGKAKCTGMTKCNECYSEFDWNDARWAVKNGQKQNRAICPTCGADLQTSRMSSWINFDSQEDLTEGTYPEPTSPSIEQIWCADKGTQFYIESEEGERTITDERLQTLLKPGMSENWFKKYVEITMADIDGELTQGDIAKQLGLTDAELSDLLITYKAQAQKLFGKQTTFRKEQKKPAKEQPQMSLFDGL